MADEGGGAYDDEADKMQTGPPAFNPDEPDDYNNDKKDTSNESGDGLMGNKKARTMVLGGFIILFAFHGMIGYIQVSNSLGRSIKALKDANIEVPNQFSTLHAGNICAVIACLLMLIFVIGTICSYFSEKLEKFTNLFGFGCILAGIVYLLAGIILLFVAVDAPAAFRLIGEFLLPSVTVIVLGLDIVKDIMGTEKYRLLINLTLLAVVGAFGFIGYAAAKLGGNSAWVIIGYIIIMGACIAYIIIFFGSCIMDQCTNCNIVENPIIRVIMAIALMVGGLMTIIGYWSIGGIIPIGAYVAGYTLLLGGMCVMFAIDMGIVDSVQKYQDSQTNKKNNDFDDNPTQVDA